jgi:branched-chain amino acid transport system permease protein
VREAGSNILRKLRNPKVVNGIGLGLVALVGVWLVVNFIKGPEEFINVALDGLTRGSIYGVVALGYTLVYGILQLINFAHGDVFSLSGLVASTVLLTVLGLDASSSNLAVVGGIILTLAITIPLFALFNATIERVAYRPLRNAPRLTPLITGGRDVVHRLEHLARALRRRLRERLRPAPAGCRVHDRRDPRHLEADLRARDHRPVARRAQLVRRYTRQGKAMRAVAQDTEASAMMGINVNRTISVTFFIAGSLAAVAGLVFLLEYNIRYDTGFELG